MNRLILGQGNPMTETHFIAAAKVDEVPSGTAKRVEVGGRSILLCHFEDRIFAIENRCSHAEQPLEGGRMRFGWIACPTHGAKFDLATGEALTGPAVEPIDTFPVRITGGTIEVGL